MFYKLPDNSYINLNDNISYISELNYSSYSDAYYFTINFKYNKNYQTIYLNIFNESKAQNYIDNLVNYLNTTDEKYLKMNDTMLSSIDLKK